MKSVTLIKSDLFHQGGLEKYTWQIARDFCALNSPTTVLTSGTVTAPFEHPLLNIVSLPIEHSLSVVKVLHFDKACHEYLQRHPTPIVFSLDRNRFSTHLRAGNGVHAAYLKRRGMQEGLAKRFSFAINPLHRAILILEKQGFEHPGLRTCFTNSHMVKQEILSFYDIDPNKIEVIHNGVEWHAMQQAFDNGEKERQDAFQFLFIGHNFQRKGLEQLLKSLGPMSNENFHLNVVGKDKDTAYFQSLAARLNLSDKVIFQGQQQDPIPFYQRADCLVIPSLYDPFANVTVEALAMGIFTLSSKNNGGHEVLTEQNGLVIEDLNNFTQELKIALNHRKTPASAQKVRDSVKHLDFSTQLRRLTQLSMK